MWWGGFSEFISMWDKGGSVSLNPHVVGRFFREVFASLSKLQMGLNPHVVGRFFREITALHFLHTR